MKRKYLIKLWALTGNSKKLLDQKIIETDLKLNDHFEEKRNLTIYTEVQEIKEDK